MSIYLHEEDVLQGGTFEVVGSATFDLCANPVVEIYSPGSLVYNEVVGSAKFDLLADSVVDSYGLAPKVGKGGAEMLGFLLMSGRLRR